MATKSDSEILLEKAKIEEQWGKWSAYNIALSENVYTISNEAGHDEAHLRRILQIVSDIAKKPLNQLRICDLACLEGQFGIEFARHGATVVGIEGRQQNIAKAQFAKDCIGLPNITFHQDDVRNFTVEKYGAFDVVLCLGILYHLDAPDVFTFLENIYAATTSFAIIDTEISFEPLVKHTYKSNAYWGKNYREHSQSENQAKKLSKVWASLDNPNSFWFTRPSLLNFLSRIGYSSTYECFAPSMPGLQETRKAFLAIKNTKTECISGPHINSVPYITFADPKKPVAIFLLEQLHRFLAKVSRYIQKRLSTYTPPDPTA